MDNLLKNRCFHNSPDKEWIIFVHGIGGDASTFFTQLKAFRNHFNLLFPDLRGHGMSKEMKLPSTGKYSLRLIAEDMFKLMDHLEIKESHFIAGSFGAILVREMEEMQPDRFLSIVMSGAVLRVKPSIYLVFKSGKYLAALVNNYFLYKVMAYFLMPRKNHAQSRQAFIDRSRNIDPREYKAWLVILEEVKHKLDILFKKPFRSPVLIIMGGQDHAFLGDCKRFCKLNPETKLMIIPKCGHLSNIEKYSEFNMAAMKFLCNDKGK
jgi:pimeloyl-ACP methyl ester carboxylesterase